MEKLPKKEDKYRRKSDETNPRESQVSSGKTRRRSDIGRHPTVPALTNEKNGAKHLIDRPHPIVVNIKANSNGKSPSKESVDGIVVKPRFANFLETTLGSFVVSGEMEETLKKLFEGANLWKVRGVTKTFNRFYRLDKEAMSVVADSKKWWSTATAKSGSDVPENSVPLIEVVEIREGWKSDVFNKVSSRYEKLKGKGAKLPEEPNMEENRCFSVTYGPGGRQILDLVANSPEEKDLWVSGLNHLVESVQELHQDRQYDLWLRKKFEAADEDKNGSLHLDEILNLLTGLNLKMSKKHAKSLFDEANRDSKRQRGGEQVLDAAEFVSFYHSLLRKPEMESLYMRYANKDNKLIGMDDLLRFLKDDEGMVDVTKEDADKFIKEYELSNCKENGNLSFDGFYHLLLSDKFNAFNDHHQKNIHMDMLHPFSHYYLSSSHNTYLTGHQLTGESSVEGYIRALKRGCRVVELDVWDGDGGEPVIYHGHTLTTKITLEDVLRDAIKIYAFEASPYPVVLSIENHLSVPQQVVMVRQLKEILGDSLLLHYPHFDLINTLPTPESLRYKILIKAKKPKGKEVEEDDEEDDPENIEFIDSDDTQKKPKPHKKLAPEMRDVVNLMEGKKFVSLPVSAMEDECIHVPSIRENKAYSLLESDPKGFMEMTERQMTKIYPLGTRTSSSNLKPYPFWSVGASFVTLNMQTEDKANFYNEAFFRSNGNCGYVLKPLVLLGKLHHYRPQYPSKHLGRTVRVRVISGQHLPPSEKKNDIVDPYIELKVRGNPLDKQKRRTKVVKNNGFNPVWNETLEVHIRVPTLSLIYFTVRDESTLAKDPVLALACIPFHSLETGYRHVHFTDITGKSMAPAALFVHISITE